MVLSLPQVLTPTPVSPSRVGAYQDCPKKYDYIYNQNLQPVGPTQIFFNKGNYWHELGHVLYQLYQAGVAPGSDYALSAIQKRIQNDLAKGSVELLPVYSSITKTMTRFITEQSPKIDKDIKIIGIENELSYLVTLPSGKQITLFGFIDLMYRDASGRLHIRDHKTGERPWTKQQAASSNQLLHYALATWLRTREVPIAEISYINTHDYVRKAPSSEQAFSFITVTYTEKELRIYLTHLLTLIDSMLQSSGEPHYGYQCNRCPFLTPCTLERKGIDPSPIISSQYKIVDRSAIRQHAKFTEEHATGDDSN